MIAASRLKSTILFAADRATGLNSETKRDFLISCLSVAAHRFGSDR